MKDKQIEELIQQDIDFDEELINYLNKKDLEKIMAVTEVDDLEKCSDTFIQRDFIKKYLEMPIKENDYLEDDIENCAAVLMYCGKNCINLHRCKPFNDLCIKYSKMIEKFREVDNSDIV